MPAALIASCAAEEISTGDIDFKGRFLRPPGCCCFIGLPSCPFGAVVRFLARGTHSFRFPPTIRPRGLVETLSATRKDSVARVSPRGA